MKSHPFFPQYTFLYAIYPHHPMIPIIVLFDVLILSYDKEVNCSFHCFHSGLCFGLFLLTGLQVHGSFLTVQSVVVTSSEFLISFLKFPFDSSAVPICLL